MAAANGTSVLLVLGISVITDAYDSKNQAQDFQGVHRERSWVDIPENHLVLQAGEENAAATDPSENSPKRDYPVLNRAPVLSPIPGFAEASDGNASSLRTAAPFPFCDRPSGKSTLDEFLLIIPAVAIISLLPLARLQRLTLALDLVEDLIRSQTYSSRIPARSPVLLDPILEKIRIVSALRPVSLRYIHVLCSVSSVCDAYDESIC
eukprot:767143-Hanusia_phi.AAC.4